MRVLTYKEDGREKLGLVVDGHIYDLEAVCASIREVKVVSRPTFFDRPVAGLSLVEVMAMGDAGLLILRRVEDYIRWLISSGDSLLLRRALRKEDAIEWLPPVPRPPVLYGIGGNSPLFFRDKSYQIPAYPRGFMRPTNHHALLGHRARVTIPSQYSTMRASAELGVVIGKAGRDVAPAEAMNHVWGYTLVNDMCSDAWKVVALGDLDESMMHKDLTVFTQRASTSYYSRSTDGFAAIGPYVVSKDEVPDPYNLMVWNRLSGVQRERGLTQAMVNGIERTVSFLSRIFPLQPGMIFHMGTMGIDGYTVEADMRFSDDDYFEIEYEGVGVLRNYIQDLRPEVQV
jgi:2-keto-4-pentenoate hydratase/2-oxohepta-3-ene-1,7-dioic acid hydratase in catechol pathway